MFYEPDLHDLPGHFHQQIAYLSGQSLQSLGCDKSGVLRRVLFDNARKVRQWRVEIGRKISALSIDVLGHLLQQRGTSFIEETLRGMNVGRHVCIRAEFSMLLGNYAGSVGGYNILPNYGQGNQDGSGFNGITMRWLGVANVHGNLSSFVQAWIQANLNQAYAERNSTTGLIWNNWMSGTTGTEYSWDESDALVGFFLFDPMP